MNNDFKKENIDLAYIMEKIDEILQMNSAALKINFSDYSVVPRTVGPVEAICETNKKMIDVLSDVYKTLTCKDEPKLKAIIDSLTNALISSINDGDDFEIIDSLSSKLISLK